MSRAGPDAAFLPYRGYSKLRARTALGSYVRAMHRIIGPFLGRGAFLISSNLCTPNAIDPTARGGLSPTSDFTGCLTRSSLLRAAEKEFFIQNLLVRVHHID